MKLPLATLLALITTSVAAAEVREDSPSPQPTLPSIVADQPLAAAPSPSMRKSFTLADLKEPSSDPVTSGGSGVVTVEAAASAPSIEVKPGPQPSNEHHGLAGILAATPSPTIMTSALSMSRGLPPTEDVDQVAQGVRSGRPMPVPVQQTRDEHHYYHPWGPPSHFGLPSYFGPLHFQPAYWGPPPFVSPHFAPSRCGDPPQWTASGPQWVPLPQAGPQWPPGPLAPSTPAQELPAAPSSTAPSVATDPQSSQTDAETARFRQAIRMHIGAKGNGMEAFLQAMLKAMSDVKTDTVAIPAEYQSPNPLVDEAANPEGRQQPQAQSQGDQVPADVADDEPSVEIPQPQPTPAATGLTTPSAPDQFAFSYSPQPEAPSRMVRVTAPPYKVEHAELTDENFANHKFSPAGLTEAPPS